MASPSMSSSTAIPEPVQSLLAALHDPASDLAYDFVRDPEPGTAQWASAQPWFREWQDADGPKVLVLDGPSGVGKSVITKHLFKTFDVHTEPGQRPRIKAYFAFNGLGQVFDTTELAMLRSLVRQILTQAPSLWDNADVMSLSRLLEYNEKHDVDLSLNNVTRTLSRLDRVFHSTRLKEDYDVYLFIDGLEEANRDELDIIMHRLDTFIDNSDIGRSRVLLSTRVQLLSSILEYHSKSLLYPDEETVVVIKSLNQGSERQFMLKDIETWASTGLFDAVRKVDSSIQSPAHLSEKSAANFLWAQLAAGHFRHDPNHVSVSFDTLPTSLEGIYELSMRADAYEDARLRTLHLLASLGGSCTMEQLSSLYMQSDEASCFKSLEQTVGSFDETWFSDLLITMCPDLLFFGRIQGSTTCFVHLKHQSLQTFLVDRCTGINAARVARAYIKHLSLFNPSGEEMTSYERERGISTGSWLARHWSHYADKAFSCLDETSAEYRQLSQQSLALLDRKGTELWLRHRVRDDQSLLQQDRDARESRSLGVYDLLQPGQLALMKVLLEPGNSVCQVRDYPQFSPLCCAVIAADSEAVDYWLSQGSDPGTESSLMLGPLFWACFVGNTALASKLLDAGACANGTAVDPTTIDGHAITWLLPDYDNKGVNLLEYRFLRFRPTNPLGAAVSQTCPTAPLLRLLLSHGANVNTPSNGVQLLHDAISAMSNGTKETHAQIVANVELLLSHGADANVAISNPIVARIPFSKNKHANPTEHVAKPPLLHAIESSDAALPLVKALLAHGAIITQNHNGTAHALLAAARFDRHEILQFLLDNGAADALDPAEAGSSALATAAEAGLYSSHVDVVRALLHHAAKHAQQYSLSELEAAERKAMGHMRKDCLDQLFEARMAASALRQQSLGETMSEAEKLRREEVMGQRLLELVQSDQLRPAAMTTTMKARHIRALMRERKKAAAPLPATAQPVKPSETSAPSTKSRL